MKLNTSFSLFLSLSFTATWASAQSGTLEMPMIGQRLPVAGLQFVNRIPRSHLEQLPKALPVYRYSSMPTCFPAGALQVLLDKSAFAGTNIVTLLGGRTNTPLVSEPIRLATVPVSPRRAGGPGKSFACSLALYGRPAGSFSAKAGGENEWRGGTPR